MTSTNEIGISGARDYGTEVYPATFAPECDAYAAAPAPAPSGTTFYNAEAGDNSVKAVFAAMKDATYSPLPMAFFRTAVNLPSFANGSMCNHQTRLFNTSLSTGSYEPKAVSGSMQVRLPMFGQQMEWNNAVGVQVDTAFIEKHLVDCEGFRGFEYQDEVPAAQVSSAQMEKVSWKGEYSPRNPDCGPEAYKLQTLHLSPPTSPNRQFRLWPPCSQTT